MYSAVGGAAVPRRMAVPMRHQHPHRPPQSLSLPPLPQDMDTGELCREHIEVVESDPQALRRALDIRAAALTQIDPEVVRSALYALLSLPTHTFSHQAMCSVHSAVHLPPPPSKPLDSHGNPWSLSILLWIHIILILYQPVSTNPVPLAISSSGSSPKRRKLVNDTTDQRAFGALTATSLAPRVLILIPHAEEGVLRALWLALVWLEMGYKGSKRGVAVGFLLERIGEEWKAREVRERENRTSSHSQNAYRIVPSSGWQDERSTLTSPPIQSPLTKSETINSEHSSSPQVVEEKDSWRERMKAVESVRLTGRLTMSKVWQYLNSIPTPAVKSPSTLSSPPSVRSDQNHPNVSSPFRSGTPSSSIPSHSHPPHTARAATSSPPFRFIFWQEPRPGRDQGPQLRPLVRSRTDIFEGAITLPPLNVAISRSPSAEPFPRLSMLGKRNWHYASLSPDPEDCQEIQSMTL
ncbi:hypothetical protein TREMEDRAFT_59021 [Tremella mesenterica DSM 1558]|uniref:uncharacterized protein n=1 Tax=Tremella mesenterica (strain ATCC 24925 / CBS 8224 / DSM 1558 / NBRC 9311 / NRRL Y-6157 / RJB 2259-6 / UBC 559-6) TaxID=578456 RepID=UPI0003F497F2|nr:uncharacterized protein TREMEDRAFT_59021 [Tremella mesenterica DSM 1558]EIW72855.1 hypothetical protein TREMEDRAFT_59021 [Tremella mesenterica DSM 1558]